MSSGGHKIKCGKRLDSGPNEMERGKVLGKVVGGIVGHLGEEERGDTNEMERGKVLGKVVGGIVGQEGEEERGETNEMQRGFRGGRRGGEAEEERGETNMIRGAGDYSWMDYIDLDVFCSYCTSPDWKVTTDKAKKNCRKYCAHGREKRGQTEEMRRGFRGGRSVDSGYGSGGENRGDTNMIREGFRGQPEEMQRSSHWEPTGKLLGCVIGGICSSSY